MNPCVIGQHLKWDKLILLLIVSWATLLCVQAEPTGWKCFTCSATSGNDPCVTDPGKVTAGSPTVACDKEDGSGFGWCYLVRQEYTAVPGEVVSFLRTCLKTPPPIMDEVITDSESTYYYRTCRTHLCNSGDGLESLGSGGGSDGGSEGNNPIIVAPESGSAVYTTASSVFTVALAIAGIVAIY